MMIEYINSDHNTDVTSRRLIEKLKANRGRSGKISVVLSFLLPYVVSGPFACSMCLIALQYGPDAAFTETRGTGDQILYECNTAIYYLTLVISVLTATLNKM